MNHIHRALERVFFDNQFFGVRRRNNQMFRDIGCDYCFWTIHFRWSGFILFGLFVCKLLFVSLVTFDMVWFSFIYFGSVRYGLVFRCSLWMIISSSEFVRKMGIQPKNHNKAFLFPLSSNSLPTFLTLFPFSPHSLSILFPLSL